MEEQKEYIDAQLKTLTTKKETEALWSYARENDANLLKEIMESEVELGTAAALH